MMKGSMLDIMLILAVAIVASTSIIIVFMFLSITNDTLQTMDVLNMPGNYSKNAFQAGVNSFQIWDQAFILLIGGLFAATLVGASQINTRPVFFIIALILLIIFLLIGVQVVNVYLEILEHTSIAPYANQFPLMIQFYQNIGVIILGFSALLMIVMFALAGRGSNGNF